MLQKYPEITEQVDTLISSVGFVSYEDFKFKKKTRFLFRWGSSIFSNRLPAAFLKYVILKGPIITATYKLVADRHVKMKDADKEERDRRIKFEIGLWKCNDIRTYMDTTITMMTLDITPEKVDLPVIHIVTKIDQYFDNKKVAARLKKVFKSVEVYKVKFKSHAPTVIVDLADAEAFIPKEVGKKIRKPA